MAKYKNFDSFIKAHLGKAMDYDGVAGAQCVDLAKYYLDEIFDIKPGAWGDAHCYYDNFNSIPPLKQNFTRIANTPNFVPKKGDIAVWKSSLSSGGWGHIAICSGEGDTKYFYSYDQNWTGNHDTCKKIKHDYNSFAGVLRPKDQSKVTGESKKEKDKKEDTKKEDTKKEDTKKEDTKKEDTKKEDTKKETSAKTKTLTHMVADISQFQPAVDYSKLKDDVDGVIVRIGYRGYGSAGTLCKDEKFDTHMKGITKNKIPYGFYFFSQAKNATEGKEEADYCYKLIKDYNPKFAVYFDSEMSTEGGGNGRADKISKTARTDAAVAFCKEIEKKGLSAGVYASTSWYNEKLDMSKIKKYSIWVADYGVNNGKANKKPSITPCNAWQFTSKYKISAINSGVDMSYFYETIPVNGLVKIDEPTKAPTSTTKTKPKYEINKTYTLQVDLKVRSGPGTNYSQKNRSQLTEDGRAQSYNQTKAVLKKGTKVTVLEVKELDSKNTFIRCASGWLCAINDGTYYIK